jgi:hypothetical protein
MENMCQHMQMCYQNNRFYILSAAVQLLLGDFPIYSALLPKRGLRVYFGYYKRVCSGSQCSNWGSVLDIATTLRALWSWFRDLV